jgi:4-hydroxyphenylpyruvate dioxygenase-like putative hemolysin
MGKVKQTIQLTASQVATANKMGMSLQDYAKAIQQINESVTMTSFNPNNHPVYSIPLSELVNLWRAKFGDTWIDVSELDDDFWEDASARLHKNKKMEELDHHSDNTPWARLKEDA